MKRRLQASYSVETAEDLQKAFLPDFGAHGEYKYIRPVRWWQLWRWAQVFSEDYVLSRAAEVITIRQVADSVRKEIDREVSHASERRRC